MRFIYFFITQHKVKNGIRARKAWHRTGLSHETIKTESHPSLWGKLPTSIKYGHGKKQQCFIFCKVLNSRGVIFKVFDGSYLKHRRLFYHKGYHHQEKEEKKMEGAVRGITKLIVPAKFGVLFIFSPSFYCYFLLSLSWPHLPICGLIRGFKNVMSNILKPRFAGC